MLPSMYVHVTFENGFIYKKKNLHIQGPCWVSRQRSAYKVDGSMVGEDF